MDLIGLDWIGLDWIGSDWIGLFEWLIDSIWFDLVWFDLVWVGVLWFDLISCACLSWFDLVWFDLVWFDLVWFDQHNVWTCLNYVRHFPGKFLTYCRLAKVILWRNFPETLSHNCHEHTHTCATYYIWASVAHIRVFIVIMWQNFQEISPRNYLRRAAFCQELPGKFPHRIQKQIKLICWCCN